MIIGIDGNEANNDKRVGIGQYAYQVLMHLNKFKSQSSNFKTENVKFRIYLKNQPLTDLPQESEWWQYKVFGPQKLWTQFALPVNLFTKRGKLDIFFSPSHYSPRFAPCKRVVSIMDLSFIRYPAMFTKKDLWQLTNWTAYSVKNADKIFTISEFSKSEIVDYYRVDPGKVVVTYPGYDKNKFKIQSSKIKADNVLNKYKIKKDYLLFVGTLQPRKNLEGLIKAFRILHEKYKMDKLDLVVAGKKGWLFENINKQADKGSLKEKIIFLDFPENEELVRLYQNATCFVLPSFYEGFGLPVLEAMACGCPVIASNNSSLPEVVGKAGKLVDSKSPEEIAKMILMVVNNRAIRNKMIRIGLERVQLFSWEKCARETLDVLIKLVS